MSVDLPVTVYVATCLERRVEAVALADALREAGFRIVSRWHGDSRARREIEATLTDAQALTVARTNLDDVWDANVVVLLWDARCRGALVEVGFALGSHARVYAAGDRQAATLMLRHRVEWFDAGTTHAQIVSHLHGTHESRLP